MSEATRMILGLIIGIAVMIVLVMKTKVHTFIALLLAALITGLIGGMPINNVTVDDVTTTGVITAIQEGFGNTLRSTGIIIGLGRYDGRYPREIRSCRKDLHLPSSKSLVKSMLTGR